MKLTCNIVQDLLPLYEDGVCSPDSRVAVEAHLKTCAACRGESEITGKLSEQEFILDMADDKKTVRSLKKVRRRWIASLLVVALMIPMVLLTFNQVRGKGICFTNAHEIIMANAYLDRLSHGDYEGSYAYIDLEDIRHRWLDEWFDTEKIANLETDGLHHYTECAHALKEIGGISEYQFISAFRQSNYYMMEYAATIGGKETKITVNVSDDGIQGMYGSLLDLTSLRALDELNWWSHNLWAEYEGCYYDKDTGQYVYDNE